MCEKLRFCDPRIGGCAGEVGVDEAIEVAVHDGIDVRGLKARARVFDEGVGHEDVVADLTAPLDLELRALDVGDLVQMLALLDFNQLRAEHAHAGLLVLELVTLRLAGDDNAGRLMNQAHSRGCFVDVLAARAGGAVDLHFDILGADVHILRVVRDFGNHFHSRKRAGARRFRS